MGITGDSNGSEMTVERQVGQRLHAFSNVVSSSYYQRTERPFGVALPEWRVLRSVILQPDLSQREIAVAEGLNEMKVSRAVAGLRRKGLIATDLDPDDRRRTVLSATDLGRAVGADISVREHVMYQHVFSVLSPAELRLLDELMARVNHALRSHDLPDPPAATSDWKRAIVVNEANTTTD